MENETSSAAIQQRMKRVVHGRPDIAWAQSSGESGWLHRRNELLVSEVAYGDVASALSRLRVRVDEQREYPGAHALQLDGGVEIEDVVQRLEQSLGNADSFGPNHIFTAVPWHPFGPAGEPRGLSALSWSPVDSSDGEGIRVGIVDTGLLPEFNQQSWLTDVHCDPDDFETKDTDANGYIDPVVGHGTFIAGVVRRWAPRATITIDKALTTDGLCDEITLAAAINQALDRNPDILSLSLGAYTRRDEAPIGLEAVWKRIKEQQAHCVVVSAAGNDGTDKHFWPAATKTVVGVGAVDTRAVDKKSVRAAFSNYGPWVDVWADGVDIESAYADGSYQTVHGTPEVRTFTGIAQWSGTSFATPLVAAAIAVRASREGVGAAEAYQRVKADADEVTGVGKVVSVASGSGAN